MAAARNVYLDLYAFRLFPELLLHRDNLMHRYVLSSG
jgi:hypothetical protein